MANSADELRQGDRFELLAPAGEHRPGEQGVVVHTCETTALVNFDHPDPHGARQEVVDRVALGPLVSGQDAADR